MPALFILEPIEHALGGNTANIGYSGQLLLGSGHQCIQCTKAGGQHLPRLLSHLPDAKRKQQATQTGGLGFFDSGHQIFRAFFTHPLQRLHLSGLQPVEVAGTFYQSGPHQSLHHSRPQAFNIHGVPAGKVNDVPQALGGTLSACTTDVGPILIPGHRGPAHRAVVGQMIRRCALRTFLLQHRHDLRDNLPGFLHQHGVPNADVLFANKILVVKRGVSDSGSCKANSLYNRLGRKNTGSAHLHNNIFHHTLLLLGRVFIGGRPTGKFRGGAQDGSICQAIYLYNCSVNVKGEFFPAVS